MEEYLKIKWKIDDLSELEIQKEFITEEVLSESLIYKNFDAPIRNLFKNPFKKKKKSLTVNNKPFIPCENMYYIFKQKSCLDSWQHEHCLKALKLMQSGKPVADYSENEVFAIKIYNDCKPKIIKENEQYQALALNLWNKKIVGLNPISSFNFNFAKCHWDYKCRMCLKYAPTYKEMNLLSLTYAEEDGAVEYKCIGNVLEVGTLAKFSHPSFKTRCTLATTTLPDTESVTFNSQLPVSKDINISRLIDQHDIDVVISNGGLKCLMDNTNPKVKWDIPVIVKENNHDKGNDTVKRKRVIFIDKPLPPQNPNKLDFGNISIKRLIKTNLCQYEAFQYPAEDIPVNKPISSEDAESPSKKDARRKIHHNAQYRIWNIKKIDDQSNLMKNKKENIDINVLIRSKLTACEVGENGALLPVIIKPKIEQQLRLGANIPTKKELARDWISLFFTPYSNLYRARLHPAPAEIVSIEKCNIQKVVSEAWTHYEYKPHFGLGILQKVLTDLLKLEPGEYLLHHLPKHESFVSLMKKCDSSTPDCYNLHKIYEECEVDKSVNNVPWIPIDVNYILPIFNANNRMPAMFTPYKKNKIVTIRKHGNMPFKKKNGKKKKKNKRKLEETKIA